MTAAPKVYILVLNWRGWRDTIECLESVFRLEYPHYRLVVCDNDSGDGSLERIAEWARGEREAGGPPAPSPLRSLVFPPVPKPIPHRVLERAEIPGTAAGDVPLVLLQTGSNLGFAGANNVGLEYARARGDADYVWLLNNDTVVDPAALSALVDAAERDPRIGIVGSKLLDYSVPDRIQAIGGGRLIRWQGRTQHIGAGAPAALAGDAEWAGADYVTGASLLARMALVEDVGALDERYFLYSEEVDWCLRARARGWALAYAAASRVWHKEGRSIGRDGPLHDYHTVRGMLLLVRRFHPGLLPAAFLYSLYRCLLPKAVRLQPRRFGAVLRAYRDLLSSELLRSRRG
jgi:GT2 family glycosyltransferase